MNASIIYVYVLECVGIEATLKLLLEVLKATEVNWKHVMIVISIMIVCFDESRKHLKALIGDLISESLSSLDSELLTAAIILARQCCHVSGGSRLVFSSYSEWFGGAFGSILPPASLQCLMHLLTELMPYEPAYCLQAQIKKSPVAPSGYQHIVFDYIALARCRLSDLNIDSTPSILGTESIQQDIQLVAAHFNKNNQEIFPSLLIASRFNRLHYEQDFLPQLFAGGHKNIIAKLQEKGGISTHLMKKYSEAPPRSTAVNREDVIRQLGIALDRYVKTVELEINSDDDLATRCSTALEKMMLTTHDQMIESLRFGLEYWKVSASCSELSLPAALLPKLSYIADRLSFCAHSHSDILSAIPASLLDGPQLSLSAWLDLERSITAEFLPSRLAYLQQRVCARHSVSQDRRATLGDLMECACRAGVELRHDVVNVMTMVMSEGADSGGTGQRPWLLGRWNDLCGATVTHETFFSVVQLLPPWLVLGDTCDLFLTQETILDLAELINVPLLNSSLAASGFLPPALVWHLVSAFTQPSPRPGAAAALSLLVQRCPPFHLALLVHHASVYSRLVRAFPLDTLTDASVKPLARNMTLCQEFLLENRSSGVNLARCLQISSAWEVGVLVWHNDQQPAYKRRNVDQNEVVSNVVLARWVFFFGLVHLGRMLNERTAEFTVARRQITFSYEDVSAPNPLAKLTSLLEADPSVMSVLTSSDVKELPLTCLTLAGVHGTSLAGLLFALHNKASCWAVHKARTALATLAERVSNGRFIFPAYVDGDTEAFVKDINYLAVQKLGGAITAEKKVELFNTDKDLFDDDDMDWDIEGVP